MPPASIVVPDRPLPRSRTSTSAPASRAEIAEESPADPPPITTTSARFASSGSTDSASIA